MRLTAYFVRFVEFLVSLQWFLHCSLHLINFHTKLTLLSPSLNLLQRTGGYHRCGRAQLGWRTFIMTCLRWILGYMRLEIWCKISFSADWCLCTALHTHSGACYYWIGCTSVCTILGSCCRTALMSRLWIAVDLARKFGLTSEQFGENLRDQYQRHDVEQDPAEPLELAEQYIAG